MGPNGQRVVTQTNRYGCFKASGAIRGFRPPIGPRLPVIMNVIFKSDRKEIRGLNGSSVSQYALPLLHIYGNISYNMNSANVSYEQHTSHNDDDTKYYVAATVNNSLYEYDEYAANDGILPPPDDIKILVHRYATSSSAPMFQQLLAGGNLASSIATTLGGIGMPITAVSPPDILYGYGLSGGQFATDQLKETAYHEFAHASHFRITSYQLWLDNIDYIIHYGSYGDATDPGADRTDLIEMWGYFMGREYAHRRYGPTRHSSLIAFGFPDTATFLNSWYAWNENSGDYNSLFESNGHIAAGFLHDIIDDSTYNAAHNLNDNSAIRMDSIRGFTITSIFNQMGSSTTNAATLIEKLRSNIPIGIGNNIQNYDSLKFYYNY